MMSEQRFRTTLIKSGAGAYFELPFAPDEVWGARERHYVAGTIAGHRFRGCIEADRTPRIHSIGAAWLRDHDVGDGVNVEVTMALEGHQADTVASDIGDALKAEPDARAFFESVAPFYRNNYIRWIETAKRPETRRARIAEMVKMLKAGEKRL
jgi:hypothetical protein